MAFRMKASFGKKQRIGSCQRVQKKSNVRIGRLLYVGWEFINFSINGNCNSHLRSFLTADSCRANHTMDMQIHNSRREKQTAISACLTSEKWAGDTFVGFEGSFLGPYWGAGFLNLTKLIGDLIENIIMVTCTQFLSASDALIPQNERNLHSCTNQGGLHTRGYGSRVYFQLQSDLIQIHG